MAVNCLSKMPRPKRRFVVTIHGFGQGRLRLDGLIANRVCGVALSVALGLMMLEDVRASTDRQTQADKLLRWGRPVVFANISFESVMIRRRKVV